MSQKNAVVIGTLAMAHEGYGFVVPEEKGVPDVFIPAHAIGNALHKDRVEASVRAGRQGKKEGRITRIISRGIQQLVGRFEIRGKSAIVVTDDFRVHRQVMIPPSMMGQARHCDIVVAEITEYPKGNNPMTGRVARTLGKRGSDLTEINILTARHDLPGDFPKGALHDADAAAGSFRKEKADGRADLTALPFITIDGEDAKDFDDAVYAKDEGGGRVRVWVAIADVSHFVKEGSALDAEASKRATSVYLPGRCIPMLPEQLSTDICSLLPDERRFCFTAEFSIDRNGDVHKPKFYKSVIKSHYRMTYTEAFEILNSQLPTHHSQLITNSLISLKLAAESFRRHRAARGSIDFDLPEPDIVLDLTGRPENIVKAERNSAHMLVEDLMIAANEAVATCLSRRGYPCIYRVHDRPNSEKLIELGVLMKNLGFKVSIGHDPTPKKMAHLVQLVAGRPEERLINMLLLRSMAQAVYGMENIGHFGLASNCYCHFTSPIRRYPDLLIHRLLADAIGSGQFRRRHSMKYLKAEAEHSSKMERRSMEAEREAHSLYTAIFMRDKVGEVYDGLVSHTARKGVFVELIEYFVEGIIKPEDLTGDSYAFDPKHFAYVGKRKGRMLRIGDKIRVQVKDVSTEERRVYFEPA